MMMMKNKQWENGQTKRLSISLETLLQFTYGRADLMNERRRNLWKYVKNFFLDRKTAAVETSVNALRVSVLNFI
jgi:hypothetical protein